MSAAKAKDVILDQIRIEVIHGHNAIAVYIALSEYAQTLNKSNFRQTIGTMQQHAFDAFILSLCKLYEKPNKRYPNYSIPTTLELLQKDSSELAKGIQNHVKLEQFIQDKVAPEFVVQNQSHIELIPGLIIKYFVEECPRTPPRDGKESDIILEALKVLRDKRVAHHEESCAEDVDKVRQTEQLILSLRAIRLFQVGWHFRHNQ